MDKFSYVKKIANVEESLLINSKEKYSFFFVVGCFEPQTLHKLCIIPLN